jgi:hypothetical protein
MIQEYYWIILPTLFACNQKEESYQIIKKMEDNIWKYDRKCQIPFYIILVFHYIQQGDFRKGMEHLNIGRKLKVFGSYSKIWDIQEWNRPKKNMQHINVR